MAEGRVIRQQLKRSRKLATRDKTTQTELIHEEDYETAIEQPSKKSNTAKQHQQQRPTRKMVDDNYYCIENQSDRQIVPQEQQIVTTPDSNGGSDCNSDSSNSSIADYMYQEHEEKGVDKIDHEEIIPGIIRRKWDCKIYVLPCCSNGVNNNLYEHDSQDN